MEEAQLLTRPGGKGSTARGTLCRAGNAEPFLTEAPSPAPPAWPQRDSVASVLVSPSPGRPRTPEPQPWSTASSSPGPAPPQAAMWTSVLPYWKSTMHSKRGTRTLRFYSTCVSFVFSRLFHNLIIIAMALGGQLTCINQPSPSLLTRFFTLLPCPGAS